MDMCIVGYKGYWANIALKAISNVPEIQVIKKLEIQDELNFGNSDFVYICTPPDSHYSIAEKALLSSKHVLLEKPMCNKPEDCHKLLKLADERNLKIGVDHTFLFSEHVRIIKKLITDKKIGEVLKFSTNRMNLGKFQDSGVVWDLLPHDLAIAMYLFGDDVQIKNKIFMNFMDKQVMDDAHIWLNINGTECNFELSWLHPKKTRNLSIIGTEGMIEYDLMATKPLKVYDKKAYKTNSSWVHSYDWIQEYQTDIQEPLQVMFKEYIQWIQQDKEFISNGKFASNIVQIIENIINY